MIQHTIAIESKTEGNGSYRVLTMQLMPLGVFVEQVNFYMPKEKAIELAKHILAVYGVTS